MKRLTLIYSFLILFTVSGFTQNYEVDWGPTYKKEGGLFSTLKLVGVYGDNYYAVSSTRKNSTLLKFDKTHKLVSNKSIAKKYEGEKIYFDKFIDTKSGTYAYMPLIGKKKWSMLVSKFDGNDFGEIKNIYSQEFQQKRISLYGFGINSDAGNKLVVSLDENKVAFTNILSMKEKNTEETMAVAVFNADLKVEWKKEQKFGYKDKSLVIKQTVVSPDGVVYVLATISDKAKLLSGKKKSKKDEDKSKNLPKYHYSIFRITKSDFKEFKVELNDAELAPIDIAMYFPGKGENDMIVSGFYTDSERKSGIKGVFFASGNGQNGLDKITVSEFKDDFLEGIASDKSIKKDRGLSTSYDIDNFIHFENGEIGFIAENYYVTSHTTTDANGNTRTTYTYHSKSLIIPRFSKEGKLLNIQKIKKGFSSSSPALVSYSMAVANDKIYLIFNDYKTKDERKDMKGKRRWIYTDLVIINNKGTILHNETLFNSEDIELNFVPFMSEYSSDMMIIGSLGRKKYAFGSMELN